jgi:hypothetical protein
MGEMKIYSELQSVKPKGKVTPGERMRGYEDNIKIYFDKNTS